MEKEKNIIKLKTASLLKKIIIAYAIIRVNWNMNLNEDYDTYSYDDYDAYNKGKLKYNGEYLYGLRNGKGKEYYKKGK